LAALAECAEAIIVLLLVCICCFGAYSAVSKLPMILSNLAPLFTPGALKCVLLALCVVAVLFGASWFDDACKHGGDKSDPED
jgi:hypothetical protein